MKTHNIGGGQPACALDAVSLLEIHAAAWKKSQCDFITGYPRKMSNLVKRDTKREEKRRGLVTMIRDKMNYEVFLDRSATPPMYGIRYGEIVSAGRLSVSFSEVDRVVQLCNEGELAAVHLKDIAEDFFGT